MSTGDDSRQVPEEARVVFGERWDLAARFARLLEQQGPVRGLIGPREVERLWDRHLLNSGVIAELLTPHCHVVDVGSGAGLPGIPVALVRPDVSLTLLEPMARRVAWLREVVAELGLAVDVVRGRAEENPVRERLGNQDAVIVRAVAPLGRLAEWCLPLLRPGGQLLALKGAGAGDEITRDASAIQRAGGGPPELRSCGAEVLEVPTTVVVIPRMAPGRTVSMSARRRDARQRRRKDRGR